MTNYLVVYNNLVESLTIIPRKIAETVNGEYLDLSLPRDLKKDYSKIESFVMIISPTTLLDQMINFLSTIELVNRDFDLLVIDEDLKTNAIAKKIEEVVLRASGKVFLKENVSAQNKTQEELLQTVEEFGFKVFKL